ncbi:uncharacterized protein B0H18DRAFT_1207961 [Fomitopsis serialis]|uniref:uncharacterized protein n=1 Tax=Fomitopsis serialis TaxID=139415 RepID=UPI002008A7BD|nr:uncharacterized protein B0H18DRAFT_1207961 [Neoantrodia serialis]KAH9933811.1 hypothetical protein B0H18DRAFT_1207961 [Neoantrodia serialis]
MRTGSRTERKDSLNGGTPTIACSIVARPTTDGDPSAYVKTYDCKPSQEVVLVHTDTAFARILPVKITLTLIDWASVFELESIILDSGGSIQALPDDPRPVRCISARAKEQIYASTGIQIDLELVAFPGVTLVAPTPEEADEGAGQGMIDRFFHAFPWLDEPAALDEQPSIILIALGTNDDAQDVSPDRFASHAQLCRQPVANIPHIGPARMRSSSFPDFTEDLNPKRLEPPSRFLSHGT